jgi:ABC-2 type transport system permease protein
MADEKRQKTDQLTLTSPVSLFGLVAGKFLAAFFIFLIGVAIMLVYALFISAAVVDSGNEFGWASVWGNTVGIILMGGVFISTGIFISSLTENQMIAAIGSIGANIVLCLFDIISSYVPVEAISNVINSLSVFYKYQEFTYGIFSLKNILFFLSLIVIFNFLTMRVIERRRWS